MSKSRDYTLRCVVLGLLLLPISACRDGGQEASHENIIRADLAEIVALQGLPCGAVVAHSLDERLDYRVECENGDVYRIHVSEEGHTRVAEHRR